MHDEGAGGVGGQATLDLCRGRRQGSQIRIHQDRPRAGSDDGRRRSKERVCRHENVASGNAGLSGTHSDTSGGGIAGFFHRLFGTETNEDDRTYYTNAVKRGKAAVVVHAEDDSLNRAADILNRKIETHSQKSAFIVFLDVFGNDTKKLRFNYWIDQSLSKQF